MLNPDIWLDFIHQQQRQWWDEAKRSVQAKQLRARPSRRGSRWLHKNPETVSEVTTAVLEGSKVDHHKRKAA